MNPSDGTTFDVEQQTGQSISNIGGDQTNYYGERSGAARMGKIVGAVGLGLSIVGVGLLVLAVVGTAHHVMQDVGPGGQKHPVAHYVTAAWVAAIGLLLGGFVLKRAARVALGR